MESVGLVLLIPLTYLIGLTVIQATCFTIPELVRKMRKR